MTGRTRVVRVFVAIVAAVVLSQFFRASNGVIAPELMRDAGLTPESLGVVNGSFFVILALAQIPVGIAFDRWGPRLTVGWLTMLTVGGSLLFAVGDSAATLLAARVLIGLGCAASFMGAVVLTSRWVAPARFTQVLSWVFALSNLGTLLATTPMALGSEAIGWRGVFVAAAAVSAAIGVFFVAVVRDAPPDLEAPDKRPETVLAVLKGVGEVWRTPGLGYVLAMHTVAYATLLTVQGLWAGAYLHDVHGMDSVTRGNVLLLMAAATVCGVLGYGPMDRRFNTRKGVVATGALTTASILAALALVPDPPAWLAAGLLILLGLVGHYGVVIVAHGRSLFPDRLVGRGVTTVNVAQSVGCALLPMLTGAVVGAFPTADGMAPEAAYRAAFGTLAVILLSGLLIYSRARDSKPFAEPA
ncbi:MFS family permease [Constrictibacter sp. MBR-5]|uniref:MFS transporter n=1 Tax=Constrictibacter sp. MBR-5 TaxID=3156467 RepID=UPI00339382BD